MERYKFFSEGERELYTLFMIYVTPDGEFHTIHHDEVATSSEEAIEKRKRSKKYNPINGEFIYEKAYRKEDLKSNPKLFEKVVGQFHYVLRKLEFDKLKEPEGKFDKYYYKKKAKKLEEMKNKFFSLSDDVASITKKLSSNGYSYIIILEYSEDSPYKKYGGYHVNIPKTSLGVVAFKDNASYGKFLSDSYFSNIEEEILISRFILPNQSISFK